MVIDGTGLTCAQVAQAARGDVTIVMSPAGVERARAAWHNGNFHTAYVGLALDASRAALFQTMALSAARLGTLSEPSFADLLPALVALL